MDLHPWNSEFVWESPPGGGHLLSEAQVEAYDRDGYVLVEGVFEPGELAAVDAEISPAVDRVNELVRQIEGGRFSVAAADRLGVAPNLVAASEALAAFVAHPKLVALCADLIGPDARLYWEQGVYKYPGNDEPVLWHQDNGYTYVEPQGYLTCWIPLVDATLDNGCVWVRPGEHRYGTLRHRNTELGWTCAEEGTEGAVAVEAPAGSVVVFSSLTPHRTGPNHTDAMRRAYIVQYVPDGATILDGDPDAIDTASAGRRPCDDPVLHRPVLVGGQPVQP